MSCCRFSSDNFMCDVYVYANVSGYWTTHVAGNRLAFPPIPHLPYGWMPELHGEWDRETRSVRYPNRWRAAIACVVGYAWGLSDRLHSWSIGVIPRRAIDLPHAGGEFNDATPGECADTLERLRAIGYHVPQYAIDALRAEQQEEGE